MAKDDVYYEPIIMQSGNCIARIFKPILTDEERARRIKIMNDAAVSMLREAERVKKLQEEGTA